MKNGDGGKSGDDDDHDDHLRHHQFYSVVYVDRCAGEKWRDFHFEVSRAAFSRTTLSYRGRRCYRRRKLDDALASQTSSPPSLSCPERTCGVGVTDSRQWQS